MDILKNLKEERDERVKDLHLDLPIPTWGTDLVGRFEIMTRAKVEKFSRQKRSVDADYDFVLQATRELYAYDPGKQAEGSRMEGNSDYVRIETPEGAPVKFDTVLAGKLDEPALPDGRAVLHYCVRGNDIAVGGLAGKLITWMQNTDAEIADTLAGES